jgi:signal transduction histidine kinase
MAAIGRLTAGVGHEVKNPINAIVVHLELLRNKLAGDSGPAARHLQIIDSEIRRLDRVVQMLADFSRPVELHLREQDLSEIVDDVLTLASAEFSRRNVNIVSQLPALALPVNVDTDLLKQAVLNVVQNGAQAMPDGGKLEIVLEDDGKTALLRIADDGPGIPEEIREKIFNLYFSTKESGSGIGLAMTYRILQLHHGSIAVKSKMGSGTEFQLRVPLVATSPGRRHPQAANAENERGLKG